MNLDTFRSRVAQSAQAAALAARQFSSLDEMAQNDEYVQSDGLRVSSKKKAAKSTPILARVLREESSIVENLSDKFVDALTTAAKPKSRPRNDHLQIKADPSSEGMRATSSRTAHKPKLVTSVAALYEPDNNSSYKKPNQKLMASQNNHKSKSQKSPYSRKTSSEATGVIVGDKHVHILHQLHYESDDSSGDEKSNAFSNEMGDLELARNNSLSDELERELNQTLQNQAEEKRRDPHRFMTIAADLEEREMLLQNRSLSATHAIPKVEFHPAQSVTEYSQSTAVGQETLNALNAGLSWVKNVTSPQLQAISKQIITKVAENEGKYFSAQDKNTQLSSKPMIGPRHQVPNAPDVENEIIMASSATFLAADDMAELERIRSKHSSSQMTVLVRSCLESLWENPRLAFVAATMILAIFVYYYSRKRSVNDVL
jgi:hypothetical protein